MAASSPVEGGLGPLDHFLSHLREAMAKGLLSRVTLSAYRGADSSLRRVQVRPVELKAGRRLSFVWSHATRDVTKNFEWEAGVTLIQQFLESDFTCGHLHTSTAIWQIERKSGGAFRLTHSKPTVAEVPGSQPHDRLKLRAVARDEPWLRALGVTGPAEEIRRGMESKYRQIHRFIELMEPVITAVTPDPEGPVRVIDMGCGKGYLTFALYSHLLRRNPGRAIEVIGLEVRSELVEAANRIAKECRAVGLRFETGRIEERPAESVTGMIALHACDTATDDALAWGVKAGADWLVCSPCCHRELRPRMIPPENLKMALRHGIFAERQAEFLTDALRTGLLEWAGYEARAFEFISPEHTAKNLMLTGVRMKNGMARESAASSVRRLASDYGIEQQRLALLLGFPWKGSGENSRVTR